jgi:hypothetical protein
MEAVTPCIRVVVVAMQRVLYLAWIRVGALNSSGQDLLGGREGAWMAGNPACPPANVLAYPTPLAKHEYFRR